MVLYKIHSEIGISMFYKLISISSLNFMLCEVYSGLEYVFLLSLSVLMYDYMSRYVISITVVI